MIWFRSNPGSHVINNTWGSCSWEDSHKTFAFWFWFFCFFLSFCCLIILAPNIMTNFLLNLGFSFDWSCSINFRQKVLDSFSIPHLFFVFALDVGWTSVLYFGLHYNNLYYILYCCYVVNWILESCWYYDLLFLQR